MPMDRALYPANWEDLATAIKTEAGWACVECGRPCRRPGESVSDLANRLINSPWWAEFDRRYGCEPGPAPVPRRMAAFTLTVAHLDHNPANCARDNLRAWCSVCHCRYDLSQMARKRRLKAERLGQLTLFVE